MFKKSLLTLMALCLFVGPALAVDIGLPWKSGMALGSSAKPWATGNITDLTIGDDLAVTDDITCVDLTATGNVASLSVSTSGSLSGAGTSTIGGFLIADANETAQYSPTVAQSGMLIQNTGLGAEMFVYLPEATAALEGTEYLVASAGSTYSVTVRVQKTDKILNLNNADAGDGAAIKTAGIIRLICTGADGWMAITGDTWAQWNWPGT